MLLAAQVSRTVGGVLANLARPEGRRALAKRTLDICLSGLGLLLFAPVWVFAAAAIKLREAGSVFVRQHGVGQGGRRFKTWKFRSMVPGVADGASTQAGVGDGRVTRVGWLLRATALDELPQLWTILTGDMSFVGPKALVPEKVESRIGKMANGSRFKVRGSWFGVGRT